MVWPALAGKEKKEKAGSNHGEERKDRSARGVGPDIICSLAVRGWRVRMCACTHAVVRDACAVVHARCVHDLLKKFIEE